jgi:DNA-binding transcriptional MerR regulator
MKIPDNKRYFRIGEVSRIIGVEPYVLRYWESEFSQIRPSRADSRQRTYQKKDLEIIFEIKRLLYDEKMTIEGAKKKLASMKHVSSARLSDPKDFIRDLKKELLDIVEKLV